MSELNIHDEWWYTGGGDLLNASDGGDYNHESYVLERIISTFCDVMNLENEWETDTLAFRESVLNMVDLDDHPEDYDPFDEACEKLSRNLPAEMIEQMRALLGGYAQLDARAFAIDWWDWIRIAGPNAELPDLSRDTLRRAWEAFCDAYSEQVDEDPPEDAEVTVSLLNGMRHSVTMADLERGTLRGAKDADLEHLSRVSTERVKQMDRDAMHPVYREKLGDSVTRTIRNLLVESDAFEKWVGCDLDGTLAHYTEFEGPTVIGKPIPAMVSRVKEWLRDGYGPDKVKKVKVFTARVHGEDAEAAAAAIRKWCKQHIGQELPVTNEKNPGMIALFDDKVELTQVEQNTGKIVESLLTRRLFREPSCVI